MAKYDVMNLVMAVLWGLALVAGLSILGVGLDFLPADVAGVSMTMLGGVAVTLLAIMGVFGVTMKKVELKKVVGQ